MSVTPCFLGGLLLASACTVACNRSQPEQPATQMPAATKPAAAVATAETPEMRLRAPRVGDVYVVQFQPRGTQQQRYYFYQVHAVRPDAVDLHPARQEATTPQAAISAPGFFAENSMTYTRAEALELLQEQPGDVQHTRLIAVRRN
ncbi:hypothetical protein K3G63_16250 [Hymenobacter sp. HSC-4F20]|uniref:hypothetical protein n=1 Tax=Hymenobacter sp. HSC-4F20 TaxID=2864135 RepID=UPI001C72F73F|nr:hypothetical protein [Hymenobacter sp. HSC-4F20]MBX0292004.1 hypothetical protein [Hymenobacter sp. HSC-4F20]